jgi:N-acetylglucosaminyldiphosphoundecaprenol N-acetyl-beta-D-mannosaminyltransferase
MATSLQNSLGIESPVIVRPTARPELPLQPPVDSPSQENLDALEHALQLENDPATYIPAFRRCNIWGVSLDCATMVQAVEWIDWVIEHRATTYAITANLNYLMLCHKHPRLKEFTQDCPLVLCDGKPLQWRSMLEKNKLPERVAGSDLIFKLAELSAAQGYGIYLLGGADGVAKKAADKLKEMYPSLKISGVYSPPFRDWTAADKYDMNRRIKNANPDILLVAFGQPKGEYWIEENYRELNVPISIQLGASFDFIAGLAKRAPKPMQFIGCEWFYRMLHDPRRLVPRYFSNAVFLLKAIRRELLQKLA